MRVHARSSGREGAALVFSIVAVMVVSILAASFLQLALSVTRRLSASSDAAQALNIAEAGLAEAYTGLAVAKTGNVGSEAQPAVLGGGLFWVEATEHAGRMVELECTAMYGTGRAKLGMVCELVAIGVTSLGIFSDDDLRMNPDVRLDSYDSSQGSYADQINTPLNNQAIIGSNNDVSVASGNRIFGDIVHGVTSTATLASGAVVTGGISPRAENEELPPVEVPTVTMKGPTKYGGATPMIVAPGEAGYASLSIGKNSKVILKGPLTLVVGSFTLASGAELVFDTADGAVEMYVKNSLDLSTGSLVSTTTQVTSDSLIFVAADGKAMNFGAKSQFYGFIYAPLADVHISAQYEIFGGVVCKSFQLAAQGKMHCDLSLGATLQSAIPSMLAWRVIELPQATAANRMDPFHVLGLDPKTLPSPADAHQDQVLEVRYTAADGSTDEYFGLESEFDWDLVRDLLYGVRDGLAFYVPDGYGTGDDIGTDPMVSLVESSLTSKQLRDALLQASPGLSTEALVAACERDPPMNKSDLDNVLDKNNPLSSEVLLAAISSASLDSGTLKGVLIENSPLAPEVLAGVLARIPPLSVSDLTAVLAKQ